MATRYDNKKAGGIIDEGEAQIEHSFYTGENKTTTIKKTEKQDTPPEPVFH